MVLVSGCHYVDCHYIYANRSTTRRLDGLWDGMEMLGLDPGRLQLEWCSAAEGNRWQHIRKQTEAKRLEVTPGEIKETRELFKEKSKVPSLRNPRSRDEKQPADFECLASGEKWDGIYSSDKERICRVYRSNSVRWIRKR